MYDWSYVEEIYDSKIGKNVDIKVDLEKIEAIYINPKWKQSKVGDCLTYQKQKKVKNEEKLSSKFDSQRDKVDFKIEPMN